MESDKITQPTTKHDEKTTKFEDVDYTASSSKNIINCFNNSIQNTKMVIENVNNANNELRSIISNFEAVSREIEQFNQEALLIRDLELKDVLITYSEYLQVSVKDYIRAEVVTRVRLLDPLWDDRYSFKMDTEKYSRENQLKRAMEFVKKEIKNRDK